MRVRRRKIHWESYTKSESEIITISTYFVGGFTTGVCLRNGLPSTWRHPGDRKLLANTVVRPLLLPRPLCSLRLSPLRLHAQNCDAINVGPCYSILICEAFVRVAMLKQYIRKRQPSINLTLAAERVVRLAVSYRTACPMHR